MLGEVTSISPAPTAVCTRKKTVCDREMDSILSPRHVDQHVETSDDDDDTKEERINKESSMATMLQHETAEPCKFNGSA